MVQSVATMTSLRSEERKVDFDSVLSAIVSYLQIAKFWHRCVCTASKDAMNAQ